METRERVVFWTIACLWRLELYTWGQGSPVTGRHGSGCEWGRGCPTILGVIARRQVGKGTGEQGNRDSRRNGCMRLFGSSGSRWLSVETVRHVDKETGKHG